MYKRQVLSIGDVVYVNVYFPVKKTDSEYKNELICLLEDIVPTETQTGLDKVVLGGDFNFQCDDLSAGFCLLKKCRKNLDLVCCESLVQLPTDSLFAYSHSAMVKGSFIDYFFVSRNLFVSSHYSRDHQ